MAETKKAAAPVVNDPWNEYEDIYIPKSNRDDNYAYVEVNGRSVQLQKGMHLKVRKPFAEAIRDAQALEAETDAYIEAHRNRQ